MLKIKNIHIRYDKKNFENTDFMAAYQKITVILGESGSGKSTLLDLISLDKIGYQSYTIDNKVVDEGVLAGHLYYGKQYPLFENNLTVKENIYLIYDLFQIEKNRILEEKLLHELQLEQTLDMYIQMLSEGEKKRLSLLIAILSQREIVLLDEPTASVDKEIRMKMISIIKKYLGSRMTIITTHDYDLTDIADYIYQINHNQLINEKKIEDTHITLSSVKKRSILKYYYKTFKHRKCYIFFNYLLTSLIISGAVIGLFTTNNYLSSYQEQLKSSYSESFVVYEPLLEGSTYSGDEYPLSLETIKQLSQLQYIEKIRPLYYFSNTTHNDIYLNNQIVVQNQNQFNVDYVSYDDSKDNHQYLQKILNDQGVYISLKLAEYIGDIHSGDTITFQLLVPQYNIYNDGYIADDNGKPLTYLVYPKEHYITVTLPIAGIEKDELIHMGMTLSLSSNVIYIPQSFMEEQLKQYQVDKGYQEDDIEYKPYMPNAYVVTLSSIKDIPQFEKDIHHMNLFADSYYMDISSYIQQEQAIQQSQVMITMGIIIVLLIIMLIVKYIKRKEDFYFFEYIQYLTNDSRYVKRIYRLSRLYKIFITYFLSLILMCISILILSMTIVKGLSIPALSIIVCFILSAFIEILASLFQGSRKYD